MIVCWRTGPILLGGAVQGLELPKRDFPLQDPCWVRPACNDQDVVGPFFFAPPPPKKKCRNRFQPRPHGLFTRALHASNVSAGRRGARSPHCGPTRTTTSAGGCALLPPTNGWPRSGPTRASAGPILPYAMHMAGPPRKSVWPAHGHRRTYGCTHFIIGPRHGPACTNHPLSGDDFYGPYQAQGLWPKRTNASGTAIGKTGFLPSKSSFYTKGRGATWDSRKHWAEARGGCIVKGKLKKRQPVPARCCGPGREIP